MADGKKERVKLADGRKVHLTATQIQLHELCKRVENLPREIIEKVLTLLPQSTLLSLKYSRGLRDVAFDLVHQIVLLYTDDALDILMSLGCAIRTLIYYPGSLDYALLIEFLTPEQLPVLRNFYLEMGPHVPSITVDDARKLIERVGTLPFLSRLDIDDSNTENRDGGQADQKTIKALRECKVLYEEDRASLFPSLRELGLKGASEALAACIFSRQCTLSQLKRLQLVRLRFEVKVQDFPRNLAALHITDCGSIGFNNLLQLARRSENTLEYLLYHDAGRQPLLNYVGLPIIECPRLRYLAIHDANFYERHLVFARSHDDKAIETPEWTRTGVGLISRIKAPELRSLGIGYTLLDATPDAVAHLIASVAGPKLEGIMCRHSKPITPGDDDSEGSEGVTIPQLNSEAAVALGKQLSINLIWHAQWEDWEAYDDYFKDAFAKYRSED